ncbi:hypothetical protein VP1G_10404 [Cytospora mali]|uniref:DUF2293 domain-containing protein n=1 Tax=Cytospora mali TaxID=578113 RepID=A0A194VHB8_CYTMA|nr:hypothetical protein VP1G_10404 [Valsa mali var. pyri (nom. inval.)]
MGEASVSRAKLPSGYSFVPKGNVFTTGNCRRRTQAANRAVYMVFEHGDKKKQIGIGVPTKIYLQVQFDERNTRAERASNVQKKDETIAKEFAKAIMKEFPRIPANVVPRVLEKALEKGKDKVGRTSTLDISRKAILAVRAYIRHQHTEYDALLRGGMIKDEARKEVAAKEKERKPSKSEISSGTRNKDARKSNTKRLRIFQNLRKILNGLLEEAELQRVETSRAMEILAKQLRNIAPKPIAGLQAPTSDRTSTHQMETRRASTKGQVLIEPEQEMDSGKPGNGGIQRGPQKGKTKIVIDLTGDIDDNVLSVQAKIATPQRCNKETVRVPSWQEGCHPDATARELRCKLQELDVGNAGQVFPPRRSAGVEADRGLLKRFRPRKTKGAAVSVSPRGA